VRKATEGAQHALAHQADQEKGYDRALFA
jgi:hypothetical protein